MLNDLRVMRSRHADLADDLDAAAAGGSELGAAAFLGQATVVTTYPTTANAYYAVNRVDVSGTEREGAAAAYTVVGTQVLYALNLGSQIPPQGTRIVCHAVGGRFVFRYDG